ncbi:MULTISPECIES: YSIRK-type signal peptide-containing protein [unclassified Streptococcus]|nr:MULTISPECIES: YSIRK-type signal peptide-containing protein [unclassified Streptococcus]
MFYKDNEDREKQLRFSIRKVSFGAASVAVAALYLFMGSGAVSAAEAQTIQSNEEVAADKDSETEKKSEDPQLTYAAPAAKKQGSATNTEAGDEGKQESHPETKEEEANSSERSETTTKTQSDEDSVSGDSSSPKSTEDSEGTRSEEASNKPKVRKRRDISATPGADVATDDPSANQTYIAPSADASVEELVEKLKTLPNVIENNNKINGVQMKKLGDAKGIALGEVRELDEFGGWKAVTTDGQVGKFAIARKTAKGVFPAYTININRTNDAWLREQVLDWNSEYTLLLSKVVTKASRDTDVPYDGQPYKGNNESGKTTARTAKGFDGIEKTFKVYSSAEGSKVRVDFKTGYTGDVEGSKAEYKVEVYTDNSTNPIYTTTFRPDKNITDKERTVIAAKDGTKITEKINVSSNTKEEIEGKMALDANRPNGTVGRFTSKLIELPKGVTSYKVRLSLANKRYGGMSYNSSYLQYSLPITGLDFNITQDTKHIAKSLLQQAYNKLLEDQQKDEHRKTKDSVRAYRERLAKIKELLDSNELKNNSEYLSVLESAVYSRDNLIAQNFEAKTVKQVKDSQVLIDLSTHPEKVITYKENSVEKALPDYLVASWKNTPDFTTVGPHTGIVAISEKGDAGAQNQEIAEVTVSITIYPKAEAGQAKFVNVLTENNRLLDGDNPENYVKFVNGNQTVAKPADMTVTWHKKPDTTTANVDQEGIVKVSYSATDENGALSTQSYFVTVKVPVYPPAQLKNNVGSYNNKQGTLSNGTNPEDYIEFKDGNQTVAKPAGVTVRWQGSTAPGIGTASAQNRGIIEVVYPSGDSQNPTVKTLEVALPTYHSVVKKSEYTRDITQSFDSNQASNYVTTTPNAPTRTEYFWKTDETRNKEYGSATWGNISGDWLGKKTNKVKVYYPNANGGNPKSENLAEETTEITFITKPAKPSIATNLTGKAGTRTHVSVTNATPGTTLYLYNGTTQLGSVEVPKNGAYSKLVTAELTPTADIPASTNLTVKSVYMPNDDSQRVESDSSDPVSSTQVTVSAKGTIQTLAGSGNITELSNLNQATLSKLLTLSDGSAVDSATAARWESGQNIAKGEAGTRTEKLFVRLPGHTKEQEVTLTIKTLAQPTAKPVLKAPDEVITNESLSHFVTDEGAASLAWEGNPAVVTAGRNIPRIKVTYPAAGVDGIAFSDVTTQYVIPTIYGVKSKSTDTYTNTQNQAFDTNAANYVEQSTATALPAGMTYGWEDGEPSAGTVGEFTRTVISTFGNGNSVPAELRGRTVKTVIRFAVKPTTPVATANEDGSVGISIPDGATRLDVTYTPTNGAAETTTSITKNGLSWVAQGLTVTPSQDGSRLILSADDLKDGTELKGVAVATGAAGDLTSADSNTVRVKAPQLSSPVITQEADYSIQIALDEKATHAEVSYTDVGNTMRKLTFDKRGDEWIRTDNVHIGSVVTTGNNIVMAVNTAKSGTLVSASQKTELSDFSVAATHKAIGLLNNPVLIPNDDTSVTIEAPQDATSLSVTYTPANGQEKTVTISKTNSGWISPDGFEVKNGNPTLMGGTAQAGRTVKVKALGDSSESKEVSAVVKTAQPSEIQAEVKQNGDFVLTLPTDADQLTLHIPTSDTVVEDTVLSKANNWELPAGSLFRRVGNTVVIPANLVKGSNQVTYVATAGSGAAKSEDRAGSMIVPTHTAPTVADIIVAANGAPTANQVNQAVTADNKQTATAQNLPTVLAGQSQKISATVTYQDNSQEIVDVTVKAKYATPAQVTGSQKDNGDLVFTLPQDADDVTINYEANDGSKQTAKLHKEGNAWTVVSGNLTVDGSSATLANGVYTSPQAIELIATAGEGDQQSEQAQNGFRPTEHTVTSQTISKVKGQTPTNDELLNAITADKKQSAVLKDGTQYPTTVGNHTITVTVTYADGTTEDIPVTYKVTADKKALEAAKAELDQGIQAAPDTSGKTPDSVTAYNKAKTEAETAAQEAQVVINDQNASEQAVQDAIAKVTKAKEALDQAKTNLTPAATEQEKQALTVAKNNLDTPATTTGMTPESIDAYNKAKDAAQAQVDEAKAEAQAALDKETLDKSELSKQTQTLENLLRSLTGVSNPTTDSARLVLAEAKKALADDSLTEQGLRHILQTVKDAIASLESIKESQSATKAGEQKVSEAAPEADKPVAQTQISVGAIVASILVLLGLLFFLLARRNKESELEKLTKELSKLLKNLNLETVDKDVLKKSQEELQNAVSFLADEKGSEHTEAELIDNLKEVIAKLKANA